MTALVQQTKNEAVLAVIDRVLNQIFGEQGATMIYRFLEHNYSLKHDEISDNIELFARGLEEFLTSGARVIERKILEDIETDSKLLRRFELKDLDDEADFVARMKLVMHRA
jgi:hypothetical protein